MLSRNKIFNIIAILIVNYSFSSLAKLAGAEGTFRNVNNSINNAVHKAERMFEENHGQAMQSGYLVSGKSGPTWNPYLAHLNIAANYTVEIQFAGGGYRSPTGAITGGMQWADGNNVPVAKGLLGSQIILIPVYNQGDEKITAWECLTNTDRQIQEFLGSTGTKNFTASLIREYTNNTYLSLCTFVDKEKLFSIE